MLILVLKDKCSSHPSLNKLLFLADKDTHTKDPQLVKFRFQISIDTSIMELLHESLVNIVEKEKERL